MQSTQLRGLVQVFDHLVLLYNLPSVNCFSIICPQQPVFIQVRQSCSISQPEGAKLHHCAIPKATSKG